MIIKMIINYNTKTKIKFSYNFELVDIDVIGILTTGSTGYI